MDNLEIYVPPQCNEECFNMVPTFGKEEVSQYQLPEAPMLNAAFSNLSDSFPVTEKVPPFTTSIQMVDKPTNAFNFMSDSSIGSNISAPTYNSQSHVPRSAILLGFKLNGTFPVRNQPVSVSSPAIIYRNHLGIDLLSRNQQSHFVSSTCTPCFGSIDSIPVRNDPTYVHNLVVSSMLEPKFYMPKRRQPTHISNPPNLSQLCYDTARKLAYNPRLGCISFVEPSVSVSVTNQQISPSFANSHGCLTSRDQLDLNLAMPSTPHNIGNEFQSFIKVPKRSLPNLLVGQISSSNFPINQEPYKTCSECGKQFPTFHALGGHISAHAKARKRLAKMTSELYVSDRDSFIAAPDLRVGLRATPNASVITSAATYVKVEGFTSSNEVKQGFSSSSVGEFGLEKFSSSEETVRKCSSISSN